MKDNKREFNLRVANLKLLENVNGIKLTTRFRHFPLQVHP